MDQSSISSNAVEYTLKSQENFTATEDKVECKYNNINNTFLNILFFIFNIVLIADMKLIF